MPARYPLPDSLPLEFPEAPGYSFELVFCVDGRRSMAPVIDEVKDRVLALRARIPVFMDERGHAVRSMRAKLIVFRDYACDGSLAMEETGFFDLPGQEEAFVQQVRDIRAESRSGRPGSALEALALAMRSDWGRAKWPSRQRHAVILFTNERPLPLGNSFSRANPSYPAGMPASLDELAAMWEGDRNGMPDPVCRKLCLFAPGVDPWDRLRDWGDAFAVFSDAGTGLGSAETESVLAFLCL